MPATQNVLVSNGFGLSVPRTLAEAERALDRFVALMEADEDPSPNLRKLGEMLAQRWRELAAEEGYAFT